MFRLGQTRDVNIYKLTVPETVEGRILGVSFILLPASIHPTNIVYLP
jgi:hypothetical protein